MYRFDTQKRKGAAVERLLDEWFGQLYRVQPATPQQQMAGIDRVFSLNGPDVTVEYKADWKAHTSGNAWIEVQVGERPGWALSSQADAVFYYLPQRKTGYWLQPQELRRRLADEWRGYPRRLIHNGTYTATGVLVPLAELTHAVQLD